MKKKLLSILLITATLLCFGCGGGSSSATNSGNYGGSANNSSDSKQTGDLYGTKKPVSATYKNSSGDYPMTFEFNDDGSYIATINWGITSTKYYFASNGIITKSEKYDSSNQLTKANYFVNGVCYDDELSPSSAAQSALGSVLDEVQITNTILNYDSNGNVTSSGTVTEKWQEYESSLVDYGNLVVDRDDSGKIIKTTIDATSKGTFLKTTYVYLDNSVTMLSTLDGIKVTYNSHGAIETTTSTDTEGTPSSQKNYNCTYTYDEYGFLTSIKSVHRTVTIEYTY